MRASVAVPVALLPALVGVAMGLRARTGVNRNGNQNDNSMLSACAVYVVAFDGP